MLLNFLRLLCHHFLCCLGLLGLLRQSSGNAALGLSFFGLLLLLAFLAVALDCLRVWWGSCLLIFLILSFGVLITLISCLLCFLCMFLHLLCRCLL